jgi:hypothetical protein
MYSLFAVLLGRPSGGWDNNVARMRRLYKTRIGLITGFIGSHTVTHNYSVYTLHSQFTIVLAESPYIYN